MVFLLYYVEMGRKMDWALDIRGLYKNFVRPAVVDLNLLVAPGEFFALLGPNGAGKTTTLRMVAGLLKPERGTISIFGIDVQSAPIAAKRVTAWLPDEPMIYDKLTPLEYLEYIAGLWSVDFRTAMERADALLHMLDLWDHRNERCEGFSRGMKQKAALAGALIHDPKLLILDEPLSGLDAAMAKQVKDLLVRRVEDGATVILTTHVLEIAERLAGRIGIINRGCLVIDGTLEQLRTRAGNSRSTLEDVFLKLASGDAA
jgi:ABC-2 type transport system ATP-binding protein